MTSRVGGPIQPSGSAFGLKPTETHVLTFKDGVWKAAEPAGPFISATDLVVANAASPTELNSYGTAIPDWRLVSQAGAASDGATLYRLDASSDAQSLPYIVSSATAGYMWVAVAGRYINGEVTASTGFTGPHVRADGSAGVLIENNSGGDVALLGAGGGTGVTFYGGVIHDSLTASRLIRLNGSKQVEVNAALTNTRILYSDSNGWPTDSANLTFSGTLLTVGTASGNSVAISSSTGSSSNTTGALTVVGGIGAQGNCYLGGSVVIGSRLGVGGAPASSTLFYIPAGAEAGVSGANQYGLAIGYAGSGTTRTVGFDSAVTTANSAITVSDLVQFGAQTQIVKGAASTITRQCSLFTRTQNAAGTANIGWFHGGGNTLAGSGTWAMYNNTTDPCLLGSGANIVVGSAALSTSATNGFLYVPTCAGTPTGVPTAYTGMAPVVIDSTNNKLYFYSNSAWRDAGP